MTFRCVSPLAFAQTQSLFGRLDAVFTGDDDYNAFQPSAHNHRQVFGHINFSAQAENLLFFVEIGLSLNGSAANMKKTLRFT